VVERNGQRLYVPEEQSTIASPSKSKASTQTHSDDTMQLDNTKHKVYIYDLDAELSDTESDDGKLVFLPDIEKHLRETRIPPSILANSDGELAGNSQLVLYTVPSSLTVPEEEDSVRRAIIEARARARVKQDQKRNANTQNAQKTDVSINQNLNARNWYNGMVNGSTASTSVAPVVADEPMDAEPIAPMAQEALVDYPDAMDLG